MSSIKKVSASFSRPANTTAYQAADLVADNATAGNVTPLAFSVGDGSLTIKTIQITKTDAADVTNADFSLHLFGSEPTVTNGDNGALVHTFTDKFADVDFATMLAASDYSWAVSTGLSLSWVATGYIYGLIEADGAYTPASGETFEVTLVFDSP